MLTHKTLLAWQKARALVLLVFQVQKTHWKPWSRALWDQLQRSSLSAQVNVAEGYCGLSRKRWLYFLTVAHGSAVESLELAELLKEMDAVPADTAEQLVASAEASVRLLHGLLKRTRAQLFSRRPLAH